jgi:hypothetical protein
VTSASAREPTLDEVQAEHPGWRCFTGTNRLCYAEHGTDGRLVRGEDPLDLRDQIKRAEARRTFGGPA